MAYKDIEKRREYKKAYHAANRENLNAAAKARYKARYAANPEKARAARRAHYAANPEKVRAANNVWRAANPEKTRGAVSAWAIANPEKIKATQKAWRVANPEKARAAVSAWGKANSDKRNAHRAKRTASKLQAIPLWTDVAKVASIYKFAQMAGMAVDHIVPLQNELVCGLHCQDNLQLLTAYDNQAKNNRFDPLTHVHILPEMSRRTASSNAM